MKQEEFMSEKATVIRDEANYRKMLEPFESDAAANAALEAFFNDLRELRAKHRIADVYTIAMINSIQPDGTEGQAMARAMNGNGLNGETMVAWALGQEQANRQQNIATILAAGGRRRTTNEARK